MAKESSRPTDSTGAVKSGCLLRRNSLPLFRSDQGKEVPRYLRASIGSCHDHCKYGRRETVEVKQYQPGFKRQVVAGGGSKASVKPKSIQDDSFKILKPRISPEVKTPEASSKQSAPREKDTKASAGFTKSVKPKLLKEKSLTKKSAPSSGHENHKIQKDIVPKSGNSRDAKTNIMGTESGKLTKPVKGPASSAAVKQNAKAKSPSSSHTPSKIATRLKPLSSLSPLRVRPMTKARLDSSPTKLKPVSMRATSSSSPGSLKLKHATAKTSPPSIPSRSVSSKKTINIRSQIDKKAKSSKVLATEPLAARRGSVSPNVEVTANSEEKESQLKNLVETETAEKKKFIEKNEEDSSYETVQATEAVVTPSGSDSPNSEVVANSDKGEMQQEIVVEAEFAEKNELFEKVEEDSSHETVQATETAVTLSGSGSPNSEVVANSDKGEFQQEIIVEAEFAEKKELFEKIEEDSSHETENQTQELTESFDDEVPEKTLYIVTMETGNTTQPASNAEEDIPDVQPLASLSQPQSPSSPISVTESNMTTQPEASLELTNTDTAVLCADQETPDIEPLQSLSPAISPKSQSSKLASNELSHYGVSLDGSMYSESEEGYSSYEDEHLVEGENLKEGADDIKVKKSVRVISRDNGKDPVKLRFRRGRVIEIAHENQGPRRLKFRRAKVLDEKAAKDFVRKSSFKIKEATQVDANADDSSAGAVVLRHQDMQDKKDAQGLLNNVIEETASKLVEKRKSMVKALVGAFETVILLQDGKPATSTTQDDQ